jgi:CBS domain-containing protein
MSFESILLIEGRGAPLCIQHGENVQAALELMVEHDFSQLPVVDEHGKLLGIISEQVIVRNYYHLKAKMSLLDLRIDHLQSPVATVRPDEDLFEALDRLRKGSAVVVIDRESKPIGILTEHDSTRFFRELYADLLRVEDVEVTLRQYAERAFPDPITMTPALIAAFGSKSQDQTTPNKKFDGLTLGDLIHFMTHQQNWPHFQGVFEPRDLFLELMHQVRMMRNQLAHFKNRLSIIQRDSLMRASYWIAGRPKLELPQEPAAQPVTVEPAAIAPTAAESTTPLSSQETTEESTALHMRRSGKYEQLRRWLLEQRKRDAVRIVVTFQDLERIIAEPLPAFAYEHASFWANDTTSHTQARAWLEAGWRVESADLRAKQVTFRRDLVMQRFFADLLTRLKMQGPTVAAGVTPPTETWCSFSAGRSGFYFDWAFSRNNLRVEFFVDTPDREKNKQMFAKLDEHKAAIEQEIGMALIWESKEHVKLSKVFVEHDIDRSARSADLEGVKQWAVDTMVKFVDTFRKYMKDL